MDSNGSDTMRVENRRIVRNTGLLYFRLILLTFINLYTVRITLQALGKVDYGIFELIAYLVFSLTTLTGAMSSATQRYLSFHLGRNDYEQYSHTFSLLLICFITAAGILILLGEGLGYFFIFDWLTIPVDKRESAFWVYQASILSFSFGLITIPYSSSIIANERMDAFAIFSIVEGILKLGVAFWLANFGGNRLILYGILTAAISVVVFIMSLSYCHAKFKYCKYIWKWDRQIFTELSKYTGWNMFGSVSAILATSGQNILLNIFFGPIINTSKAIADKIQHVINGFSINLYMAVSPQIIKSYAVSDIDRTVSLVLKSSKISFMLIFALAFPLICNMNGILNLWLAADAKTPDMVVFSKLILIYCMIFSLESPISRLIQATGNIRRYQLSVGIITLCYIPIAALVLYLGGSAVMTVVVLIIVMSIAQCMRVYVAHHQVGLDYGMYFNTVILPILKVAALGIPLYLVIDRFAADTEFLLVAFKTLASGLAGLAIIVTLGLDRSDRSIIKNFIKRKSHK
ncbi:MAG: hypothetical protein K2K98_07885 [Muribaculaceae bacterium]|nr:hypothetical protein [Muribaculaceae bacterium]